MIPIPLIRDTFTVPRSSTREMSSPKQHAQAGKYASRSYESSPRRSQRKKILTICPPSLMGQVRDVLGHCTLTPSTPAHQPALNAAANDITHEDDNSGTISRKPSNLPTA